jgi:hypothetical protein
MQSTPEMMAPHQFPPSAGILAMQSTPEMMDAGGQPHVTKESLINKLF